jgi:acyl carrier protein
MVLQIFKHIIMEDKIKEFIQDTFLIEFDQDINEDTDLFKAGVLDSFGYIQLIKFLESEYEIRFSEEEILSNIMVSLSNIIDYISNKVTI